MSRASRSAPKQPSKGSREGARRSLRSPDCRKPRRRDGDPRRRRVRSPLRHSTGSIAVIAPSPLGALRCRVSQNPDHCRGLPKSAVGIPLAFLPRTVRRGMAARNSLNPPPQLERTRTTSQPYCRKSVMPIADTRSLWRRVLAGTALCLAAGTAGAADLAEPITLSSQSGVLDVLMVAKAATLPTLSPFAPTGWVYEICLRPTNGADACPSGSTVPNYYGGTHLHLKQGDTLRVHLVNQLPPVADAKHAVEPGHESLALNPTNIHTHGMLVST